MKDGRSFLLKWLHKHPGNASLWFQVSRYLLENMENKKTSSAAASCALSAMVKSKVAEEVSQLNYSLGSWNSRRIFPKK